MTNMRLFLFTILPLIWPACSLSGGGVILYEIGSQDVGLASAGWSARAEDPSTAFTNPAGMSRLSCREFELGLQPIYLMANFDPNRKKTNVRGKSGDASSLIPAGGAYFVQPINDRWAAGVSVLGYFGSRLSFNHNWVGRYYLTSLTLQGFSCVPAVSCRLTDRLSVGFGANVMYGIFSQKAAVNNSLDHLPDGHLRIKDNDFGFGCIAGILYECTSYLRFGVQYISKVRLQFNSNIDFQGLGPSLKAKLAEAGVLNSKILLNVDVPQCIMFSAYCNLNSQLALMGNLGWQEWSDFQFATIILNDPQGTGLVQKPKYKNTWHAAIGVKFQPTCNWAVTTGFAYDSSAISATNRPLNFPVGSQWRYGAGLEWQYNSTLAMGLQYEFQWQGNLAVDVNTGALAGHVAGKYHSMAAHFLNINMQWIF